MLFVLLCFGLITFLDAHVYLRIFQLKPVLAIVKVAAKKRFNLSQRDEESGEK